jgi:hypothetical protein
MEIYYSATGFLLALKNMVGEKCIRVSKPQLRGDYIFYLYPDEKSTLFVTGHIEDNGTKDCCDLFRIDEQQIKEYLKEIRSTFEQMEPYRREEYGTPPRHCGFKQNDKEHTFSSSDFGGGQTKYSTACIYSPENEIKLNNNKDKWLKRTLRNDP